MNVQSQVIEMRLAEAHNPAAAIEELSSAEPSVFDQMADARARREEAAAASVAEAGIEEQAEAQPDTEPAGEPSEEVASAMSTQPLEESEEVIEEMEPVESEPVPELSELDRALDLLGISAGHSAVPAGYQAPVVPHIEADEVEVDEVETTTEADLLLEPAAPEPVIPETHAASFAADEPVGLDDDQAQAAEGDVVANPKEDLAAIEADLARIEADLEQYEQLTQREAGQPPDGLAEGPGEDFQELLAGARLVEPDAQAQVLENDDLEDDDDDDEPSLLPAQGDVKLRARNGPRPGAEFVGKSTLAGATGIYCLIHGFNLPVGTRMKVSLVAPDFINQMQLDDAVVTRLRKAPENAAEVQLTFDARHDEFEEFVGTHFGKPAFSLFGRRRSKR